MPKLCQKSIGYARLAGKIYGMKENKPLKPKLSKALKREFKLFLEYHPPKRVVRSLREVYMSFAANSVDAVPFAMPDIIHDFTRLMELFDLAADETKDWPEQ